MTLRLLAMLLAVTLALTAAAAAVEAKPAKPHKVKVVPQGQLFCPTGVLVAGGIVIQPGRCYTLYVLRDRRGTFLVFGPPQVFIPPGQIVRLTTPAGAKARGRVLHLVPIQTTAVLVPLNTITPVAVRVEDFGPQVAIVLTSVPTVTLVFQVRL